jgi:oligogalacturonide lyase
VTRRTVSSLLIASPLLAVGRGQSYPAERIRYADPATEGEVFRFTKPAATSLLPAAAHHCVSSRNNFLLYCSDRGGSFQVNRLDLKNGESRQLTDDAQVLTGSPALTGDERRVFYAAGPAMKVLPAGGGADRELFTAEAPIEAFNVTEDGLFATAAAGGKLLLVSLNVPKASARPLAAAAGIDFLLPRPRRGSLLFRQGAEWRLAHFDGTVNRALKPMEGAGGAEWSPDGKTIFYLKGSTLMEFDPDTGVDKFFSKTSNFTQFTRNADGSVFAGLSASKAQPHVLLLLRVTRRERTICEHKSSQVVAPFFAPNSMRLFYQSDRDGKPAIYMVNTDRLIEKTEESNG